MKVIPYLLILAMLLSGCSVQYDETTNDQADENIIHEESHENVTLDTESVISVPESSQHADEIRENPLEGILNNMTLKERVGQLFLVACPELDAEAIISEFCFGGFILFDENFKNESIETFSQKIKNFQEISSIPMLIAVDEEGGTVCRVSRNKTFRSTIFPSMRSLASEGGTEAILRTEAEKCKLLRSVGINVNMSPVCDVTNDPASFMYQRTLGMDPYDTAQAIQEIVGLMGSQQIGSVLKHFPGYGNNSDTHIASATDDRPLEWFEQQDLIPFRAGIESGCDAILVSHTIVSAFDSENPASLSKKVHDYIREEMGFQGVIITDDLTMSALRNSYSDGEAAIQAVLAGNDLICTWEYEEQYQSVYTAVMEGEISIEQINASVLRILRWKQKLGLLDEIL